MEWSKRRAGPKWSNEDQYETPVKAGKAVRLIVHGRGGHWFALARDKYRHIIWMMPRAYVSTREEAQRVAEAWAAIQ